CFIVHIRDQDIKVLRVHAANVMNVNKFTTFRGLVCSLLGEEAYWTWARIREAPGESCVTWRSRERSWCSVEMARLKRTAERIGEGGAEGIAKSLEGLPT